MSTPARRFSRAVRVADKVIGGDAPILVQSMTNTDTEDARATAEQVAALARAGSEIVRITVNTLEAARQVPEIRRRLEAMGVRVPLLPVFVFGHARPGEAQPLAVPLGQFRQISALQRDKTRTRLAIAGASALTVTLAYLLSRPVSTVRQPCNFDGATQFDGCDNPR